MPALANDYPDEVVELRRGLATFVERVVVPMHEANAGLLEGHARFTPDGHLRPEVLALMREVREKSAEAGYYTMCVPQEMGGMGFGYLANFAAWEQIFHMIGARYWLGGSIISHWVKGPSPVLKSMRAELLEQVLPGLMSGEKTLCFTLSEPGAGSDAAAITTSAVAEGDGWRLNGAKIWITNGANANYAVVFAVTDPAAAAARQGGISAFLVPTDSPGFEVASLIRMWGEAGTDEVELRFDGVRIEKHQLLGELHRGFGIAMLGAGLGRMYNCGRAIGIGRWALEMGIEHAKVRKTFGKVLSDYQGIMFPLADSTIDLHGAHLIARNAAMLLDQGGRAQKELSMAKAAAIEAACTAVDRVMQIHGAMGFTNEMHLTEAYATLRKARIADGASEIMRRQIVKAMISGDVDV